MEPPVGTLRAVPLREAARAAGTAGTKAATLGRLLDDGLAVPDGLVLPGEVYDAVRESNGLGTDPSPGQVAAALLPAPVQRLLDEVLDELGDRPLAVRSSALAEDTADTSFAGQYDTVLGVRGRDELRAAVLRCWASAHGDRVRAYRGEGPRGPAMAVLVQHQVDADVAGVAFTADPVTGDADRVLVSAAPGLTAVTDGTTRPDEWVVAADGARPLRVLHQALAAAQASAVAALATRIERTLALGPVDVEWAMADGRLLVLQARPITALPVEPVLDLPPGTWVKESDRHPEPLTALGASVAAPVIARGLTLMFAEYGGLLDRMETRSIGGEPYLHAVPPGGREGPPPAWWMLAVLVRVMPAMRRRMRAAHAAMRPGALERIADRWHTQWRPELRSSVERLRAVDLPTLTDADLLAHLDRIRDETTRAMDVHFRMAVPHLVPVHHLVLTCDRLLGWPEERSLLLLTGTSGTTSAPVRELAALARRIRRDPAATAAVRDGGADTGSRLAQASPELHEGFAQWCEAYGHRNVNDDPGSPLLVELPALLGRLLRDAVAGATPETGETGETGTDGSGEAARLLGLARDLLDTRPRAERDDFEAALDAARRAYPLREDVAFWTGSLLGGCVRLAALEFGRRLTDRGALTRPEDAVHLPAEMLRDSLPDPDHDAIREQVRRSRAERAWVRLHPGPAWHGPDPAPPPDLRGLPPAARRMNEAFGWMRQPPRPRGEDTGPVRPLLRGVAASPGRHTGPVRLIAGSHDFGLLRPGDVLVCRVTDPAWTVLFGTAGALVTDGGGVLSHAAIVAREVGVPAVVGTGTATCDLRDGQTVTVDGSNGTVLPGPAPTEGDPR